MSWLKDLLTGRERARQEAAAELSRQRTREAREAQAAALAREMAQPQPETIQRAANELRPGERMIPSHIERQRELHDHPPQKLEKKPPDIEREATRLENTMTPQPAPSIAGPGVVIVNKRAATPRAPGRSLADELLAAGQAKKPEPEVEPAKKPEIRLGRRSLFPDYSQGMQIKPPGDDDQA